MEAQLGELATDGRNIKAVNGSQNDASPAPRRLYSIRQRKRQTALGNGPVLMFCTNCDAKPLDCNGEQPCSRCVKKGLSNCSYTKTRYKWRPSIYESRASKPSHIRDRPSTAVSSTSSMKPEIGAYSDTDVLKDSFSGFDQELDSDAASSLWTDISEPESEGISCASILGPFKLRLTLSFLRRYIQNSNLKVAFNQTRPINAQYTQSYYPVPTASLPGQAFVSYPCTYSYSSYPEELNIGPMLRSGGSYNEMEPALESRCWDHGCNGRAFSTHSNYLRHQREKNGQTTKVACPRCDGIFTRKAALSGHIAHDKCKPRKVQINPIIQLLQASEGHTEDQILSDSGQSISETGDIGSGQLQLGPKKRSSTEESLDDQSKVRYSKRRTSTTADKDRVLACPYSKYDSLKYGNCHKYVLREISRVKQHLARCHRVPIHCPICSSTFDCVGDRDVHLRERTCNVIPPKQWNGIDEAQERQLRRRVSSKKTREQNWYIIYAILFPGTEKPQSPYVELSLSDEILALQDFAAREGPSIVNDFIASELPESLRLQEEEVQSFSRTLFRNGVDLILQRWGLRQTSRTVSLTSSPSSAHLNSADSGYDTGAVDLWSRVDHSTSSSGVGTVEDSNKNHQQTGEVVNTQAEANLDLTETFDPQPSDFSDFLMEDSSLEFLDTYLQSLPEEEQLLDGQGVL